ncbi:MAG: O-antigen ligase family protein [Thiohalorhabdus sp.]|uniref:O-antigen ligase family protein n=1 Tax=Thiohalorhabdus sp. TaxID=3094134 RepID=UPI00397F2413
MGGGSDAAAASRNAGALGARGVLVLGLLGAAFGLALFFNGLHIPLLAASGVLLVAALAVALGQGIHAGWRVPRSPAAGWLVAWWVFLAVSLAWSTVVYTSSLYYWWLSALPLTFYALVLAPRPQAWARTALTGYLLAAGGLALWALVQFFALPDTYGYRAHHPLINPNNLAGLLNLALLPAVAGYLRTGDSRAAAWRLGGVLLLLAGVVATQSRGGYVGLGLGLLVLLAACRGAPGAAWPRLAALALGGGAVFAFMNAWAGGEVGQRLETLGAAGAQTSLLTRFAIWEGTWHMVLDRPWLGFGLGTFFLFYPRYRLPADGGSGGYYAHMDPLQLWAEVGIGGPALLYLFLTAVLVQTVRAVRAEGVGPAGRLRVLGPFAGLLAVAVHTHITFHLYILPLLIAAGVVLAAWQVQCEAARGRQRALVRLPRGAHPRVWRAVLAGVVALVVLDLGAAAAGDRFIRWGKAAVEAGDTDAALSHFHNARAVIPNSDTPWALGAEIRLAALGTPQTALDADQRRTIYGEAHHHLDRAQVRNPARARLDHLRARLYLAAPEGVEEAPSRRAEDAFRRALAKDPRLVKARQGLAELLLGDGREKAARAVLEEGLQWPYPGPRGLALYLRAGELRERAGDAAGALTLARSALERIPAEAGEARSTLRARIRELEAGLGAP